MRQVAIDLIENDLKEMLSKVSLICSTVIVGNGGLIDHGKLAFGDVTVFNPKTVIDRATFANPTELRLGIQFVFVNGTLNGAKVSLLALALGAFPAPARNALVTNVKDAPAIFETVFWRKRTSL